MTVYLKGLKPCPFCAESEQTEWKEEQWNGFYYRVRCDYCGAMGEDRGTMKNAIEAWNTRKEEKDGDVTSRKGD